MGCCGLEMSKESPSTRHTAGILSKRATIKKGVVHKVLTVGVLNADLQGDSEQSGFYTKHRKLYSGVHTRLTSENHLSRSVPSCSLRSMIELTPPESALFDLIDLKSWSNVIHSLKDVPSAGETRHCHPIQ